MIIGYSSNSQTFRKNKIIVGIPNRGWGILPNKNIWTVEHISWFESDLIKTWYPVARLAGTSPPLETLLGTFFSNVVCYFGQLKTFTM